MSFFVLANDGYKLWLQYYAIQDPADWQTESLSDVVIQGTSPTLSLIRKEINLAKEGFFPEEDQAKPGKTKLLIGELSLLPASVREQLEDLSSLGSEGYLIRKTGGDGSDTILITANTDIGLLYGTFHYLRMVQLGTTPTVAGTLSTPKIQHRVLNHWDNLNRTVERGYAGFSIWNWHRLPDHIDQQYHDYARANASLGINGTALTNVNANALVLTPEYLEKVRALADVFRPYGIKVYLTARFSSPMEIGGLETADPQDSKVQEWWKKKAEEIYGYIPDFGGFVVKADSEGQPGPHNYGRTQAEGANLLADAVRPHGGIVMWRAFVYSEKTPEDRHKQAYNEFKPIDGDFRDNVIVQVKNGAIDFQPREPFHPLFGAMPKTPLMMEFQITQEYLGHDTHLAYLAPLFEEVLQADTFAEGEGSTVARVVDGSLHQSPITAMSGVANIGTDRNWTGHHFHQANWFAYGKLAWDPQAGSAEIADEWLRLTFTDDAEFVSTVKKLMLGSREMVVNYMTPLGLHHIMARSHHYGPGPWVTGGRRDDWTSTYYHKASSSGVGFDRTASGSDALGQYAPEIQKRWGSPQDIPEEYLLWFHHLPWDYQLQSGKTLWDGIALHYQQGVDEAKANVETWKKLENKIDRERHAHVLSFLEIQAKEAVWWRDACLLYFGQFSGMPLPAGVDPPQHSLEYYMNLDPKHVPGI